MQAWLIQRRRPFLVGSLLLLIVALTLVGIGRFAVHAAGSSTLRLSAVKGTPGQTVKVAGLGFGTSETVVLMLGTMPLHSALSTADGSYTVTATGSTSGKSASTALKVTSSYTITPIAVPEAGAPINGINNAGQMVGGYFYGGSAFVGVPGKFTSFNSPPSPCSSAGCLAHSRRGGMPTLLADRMFFHQ